MNKQIENITLEKPEKGGPSKSRFRKWIKKIFTFLFILFVIFSIVINLPPVQTWAGKKATNFLSNKLETTVRLDKLKFGIFGGVDLTQFYMEDLNGDSLLNAENLYVDLGSGLWTLLGNSLDIEELGLSNAQLVLRQDTGQYLNNIGFVIEKLSGSGNNKEKKAGRPLNLNLDEINLENFHFLKEDSVVGQTLSILATDGKIQIDNIDLEKKLVEVHSIWIDEPIVRIDEYQDFPLPEVEEVIAFDSLGNTLDTVVFLGKVGQIRLRNGSFILHNFRNAPVKLTADDELDYQHLDVYDIQLDANNFSYSDWVFKGQAENISFKERSGFVLDKMVVDDVYVSCTETKLSGIEIITPHSTVGDTINFRYRQFTDWREFVDKVRLDAKIKDSFLAFEDIITFAPNLRRNKFFENNKEEVFNINGQLKGRINRLDGRNLDIQLPNRLSFQGKFSSRNLNVQDEQMMNLDIKRLRTSMRTLKQLVPEFNPPSNFYKLSSIDFTGKFDGFFVDWVADGKLKTNLGNAEMDMRMNVVDGRNNARYSGGLALYDFDLKEWSGNDDFGNITFTSKIKQGFGLELQNANAKLEAHIDSLSFREYDYRNVDINGQLNQKFFNGDLKIFDQNINLDFRGEIDFTDSIPVFDFFADVKELALKPLNLSKKDFTLSGEVDIQLTDMELSKIQGDATVYNFGILHNQKDRYTIDSVLLHSKVFEDGTKSFEVLSDVLHTEIDGIFDIEEIPLTLLQFFESNYPEFAQRLNLEPKERDLSPAKFDLKTEIFNTKGLPKLVDPKLGDFRRVRIFSHFDGFKDSIHLDMELPSIQYGNVFLDDIVLITKIRGNETDLDLGVFKTNINNKVHLAPITLLGLINQDTVEFAISSINLNEILDNLNLNGLFYLDGEDHYKIKFYPSDLVILNDKWDIDASNYLRVGKGTVETQDFKITNKDKVIKLSSIDEKGLELLLENINLAFINEQWIYEPLMFDGTADLKASVKDLFQMKDLSAELAIDTLWINEDDWGSFRLDAETASLKESINSYFSLSSKQFQVIGEGFYNLPSYVSKKQNPLPSNFFDFDVNLTSFPVNFLEYLLIESISETEGNLDGKIRFYGEPPKVKTDGIVSATNVATTINFLKTRYFVKEGSVKIDSLRLLVDGTKIRDELGNYATASGGLIHDHLKNFGLDVYIQSDGDKFLALNTKEEDNPLFYGTGIGYGYVRFTGPFAQTNAEISATTSEGTKIIIPISSEEEASENSFFVYEDEFSIDKDNLSPDIRGLNLEMNLQMTQAAEVELIFDKKWGDIIRGNGDGNIQIIMTRNGDFEMRGNYIVNEGDYLFTLGGWLVNKPFMVEKGGIIKWDGDPYNADININAIYEGLQASVYSLIQEFVVTAPAGVLEASRNSTVINLGMNLSGDLFNPNIKFNIDFPNLSPELKSYTDSKLRILEQDQNELNRQVFGLLVSGQFLPTGGGLQAADIGINTISEMIASQLSIYVTELVSEWLRDGGFISGIGIDFSYGHYNADGFSGLGDISQTSNELTGKLKLLFKDDRFIFHAGGNFDLSNGEIDNIPTNTSQWTGEFMLEYVLTEDRKFKVRLYQRTEPDLGGRRNKIGAGLSFRKEFDSIKELFERQQTEKEDTPLGSDKNKRDRF